MISCCPLETKLSNARVFQERKLISIPIFKLDWIYARIIAASKTDSFKDLTSQSRLILKNRNKIKRRRRRKKKRLKRWKKEKKRQLRRASRWNNSLLMGKKLQRRRKRFQKTLQLTSNKKEPKTNLRYQSSKLPKTIPIFCP